MGSYHTPDTMVEIGA